MAVVGFTALAGVFTYLRSRWAEQASESIVRSVRDRMYGHMQKLPASYFDSAESGDLVQRCSSDVETLRVFLSAHLVEIGRAAAMLLIPLPLMWSIEPRMTVASVVLLPIVVVFSFGYFVRIKKLFKAKDEAEGALTSAIQENLSGIRVVRAFARQAFEEEKLAKVNAEERDLHLEVYLAMARFWSFSDLLCFAQKGLVVGVGVWMIARGELGVGAFFFFLAAVNLFIWPVRMLGRILTDLGKAAVAVERIFEVLDAEEEAEPAAPIVLERPEVAVRFEDVRFAYGTDGGTGSEVIRGVSFEIGAGETLALVGPSGAGKSTLAALLLRLYDPTGGRITLDGVDIGQMERRAVRSAVASVLQEPFLFSKTLGENIAIARPEAAEGELHGAAIAAAIHETIEGFEHGYETAVGERGVTLSGGQRQRVAIARAVIRNPAVLLLDDAMSAVDAETEEALLGALRERHGKRTTIVIAHRLSTLAHADRVVVIEDGAVTQMGRHEELVREDGLYARLWSLQTSIGEGA
ncbi:MAG: ABC transporter ATP-binding protein [Planctomycetota bacterium]